MAVTVPADHCFPPVLAGRNKSRPSNSLLTLRRFLPSARKASSDRTTGTCRRVACGLRAATQLHLNGLFFSLSSKLVFQTVIMRVFDCLWRILQRLNPNELFLLAATFLFIFCRIYSRYIQAATDSSANYREVLAPPVSPNSGLIETMQS